MTVERRMTAMVERAEAAAWVDMFELVEADVRQSAGLDVRRYGAATALMASNVDTLAVNRILGLGLDTPLQHDVLDEIIAHYRERGVRRFALQWCPAAEPSSTEARLTTAGFHLLPPSIKLCRLSDSSFFIDGEWARVVEIGRDQAMTFEATVCAGLGVPPALVRTVSAPIGDPSWKYYLAYDGAEAIGGAALCARGDVAWCGLAATLPHARRRGVQSALLAHRVREAAALGCPWVSADTIAETPERPNQSLRNMQRLGFEIIYERKNYILPIAS
jgi:GNAT superfamily N-acetyltransferase